MSYTTRYSAAVTAKKGVVEGGQAGLAALAIGLIVNLVARNNPDLMDGTTQATIVTLGTAVVHGAVRALRNWWKNRY